MVRRFHNSRNNGDGQIGMIIYHFRIQTYTGSSKLESTNACYMVMVKLDFYHQSWTKTYTAITDLIGTINFLHEVVEIQPLKILKNIFRTQRMYLMENLE